MGVPSQALDTQLSNPAVRSRVGRRLGIRICDEGSCPFCFQMMDRHGAHAEACMGGGDKVITHNECRNTIFSHAKRGGAMPELEKGGVVSRHGLARGRREKAS